MRYEGDTANERRAASRRQALYRANESAFDLYHRTLIEGREGEEARRYLATRKLGGAELLVEAGLAIKDGDGAVRDRFRRRITFPVHDLSGKAVAIGARILPSNEDGEDRGPKYLDIGP